MSFHAITAGRNGRHASMSNHPPQSGGSFAWRTDEWYLSPETLAPVKGTPAMGKQSDVHDASGLTRVANGTMSVPLVGVKDQRNRGSGEQLVHQRSSNELPDVQGAQGVINSNNSNTTRKDTTSSGAKIGASPLGRRRKGSAPRTCSAKGCATDVLDRAQGLVVMCQAHRRVTSGVAVDTSGDLMRWCYHCKKAHALSAFADSVIGLSRKLATCERGRAARRAAFAKKAVDGARDAIEDVSTEEMCQDVSEQLVSGNAKKLKKQSSGGPKSEAATLAQQAASRAKGARTKRQVDAQRSSSPESLDGSGSYGSHGYDGAHQHGGGCASHNTDPHHFNGSAQQNGWGYSHGSGQPYHHSVHGLHAASMNDPHQPSIADWHQRTFEDVVFEVSTRASPAELFGDRQSVFDQMAGAVQYAIGNQSHHNVSNDPYMEDQVNRLEAAADSVRQGVGQFLMNPSMVAKMLNNNLHEGVESDRSGGYSDNDQGVDDATQRGRGWIDSLAASMLPGSTRVVVTCSDGSRGNDAQRGHPEAVDFALGLPSTGALGRSTATVTAHPHVALGNGWKRFAADAGAGGGHGSSNLSNSVRIDTTNPEKNVQHTPTYPFPSYINVPPVATLGEAFAISNLRGGERVHVFGQKAVPFSCQVPVGVNQISVKPPGLSTGNANPAFTPGFLFVQVLQPGQPSTGSALVKVLLTDDPDVSIELDALRRGSAFDYGVGERRVGEARMGNQAAYQLNPIPGFTNESAFERFICDFGVLTQSHWQSLLYAERSRDAALRTIVNFSRIANAETCPAVHAVLNDILEDVDAQFAFEVETNCGGFKDRHGYGSYLSNGLDANGSEVVGEDHTPHCSKSKTRGKVGKKSASQFLGDKLRGLTRARLPNLDHSTQDFLTAVFVPASHVARSLFSDDGSLPMTCETRVSLYARNFTALSLFLLIGTFRARHWGMAPIEFTYAYTPLLPIVLLFCIAARDHGVQTWLKNRSWMLGGGGVFGSSAKSDAQSSDAQMRRRTRSSSRGNNTPTQQLNATPNVFHAFIFDLMIITTVMACNGTVQSTSSERLTGLVSKKWVTGVVCAVGNLCFFALFTAEFERPSAVRFDILGVALLCAVMFLSPPSRWHDIYDGSLPVSNLVKPYSSKYAALFWCALAPTVIAYAVRRAYRVHLRMGIAAKTKQMQ